MNPLYVYSLFFTLIIIVYNLEWSHLYPTLSTQMSLFLWLGVIFSFLVGKILINKNKCLKYRDIKSNGNESKIVNIIILLYIVDFIYAGEIPFISIILGSNYDYNNFNGIPLIHKILITFNSFYITYIFHLFISSKNKYKFIYLKNIFVLIVPGILMFNRGMLLYTVVNLVFVYIFANKKYIFKLKTIIAISIVAFLSLYVYGILGNIRTQTQVGQQVNYNDSALIMEIGAATDKFKKSSIPKPLFWGYIYMTSPLANFQKAVDYGFKDSINYNNFNQFIMNEIIIDTISEDLMNIYDIPTNNVNFIRHDLTVGGLYARSFTEIGWLGPILMYFYMIIFTIIYISILKPSNRYFVTGLSTLNTLIVFNSFNNMFVYGALSLQLLYPILLSKKINYKFNKSIDENT